MARVKAEKVVSKGSQPSVARGDVAVPVESLSYEVRRRLEVVQRLVHSREQGSHFITEQKRAAAELGISARSLRRLQRQYQESGIAGLQRQVRSDQGQSKVSEYWQSFILKTYREGNKGQRQISRAQVAKLVASHAAEIGENNYPSRRSVYRILAAELDRANQKAKSRSIGWQGELLQLRTKEGIELDIEYSN